MNYSVTQSRLLYVCSINDRLHDKLLKVGEVFVDNKDANSTSVQDLGNTVRTALASRPYMEGVRYNIEHVECTTYNQKECYTADDVHRTLSKNGYKPKSLNKYKDPTTGKTEEADLWFGTTIAEVKRAIEMIKNGEGAGHGDIKFRPEQEAAISRTVDHFLKESKEPGRHFLWNAKMRFGKTLSGLEVAKRCGFRSTLIITHRPVVDAGWKSDFEKIFRSDKAKAEFKAKGLEPAYGRRMMEDEEGDFHTLVQGVEKGKSVMVFFVSMQYLRLSQFVGGKERNADPLKRAIMEYDWDFVMVDEAHEGIDAASGARVMEKLTKERTRILSLSGTPFNLLDKYDESEIYTWDYVMEQRAKQEWEERHFGDPNPYADLPRMQILTFTLPKMVRDAAVENNEAFRFHEFFRVWTEEDRQQLQYQAENETDELRRAEFAERLKEVKVDGFVHEADVRKFIEKLRTKSDTSLYPFSTKEFCDNFRHTFWLLPGVKEAAAFEQLLRQDKFFCQNFHIINVAGDGNIEDKNGSALAEVLTHIRGNERTNARKRTITLSCGKLTTGVSVPEWTAVLCLKGSETTPAANYMQTIFRVQTHATLSGRQKSDCYVFDFAPDRALTAVAETAKMAVHAQTKEGRKRLKGTQAEEERHLGAFIKLCPVLSMDEGEMGKAITANQIFEKLSNVYIERAVRSGYADNSLYNPEHLMNLTPEQERALGEVHDLLGSMPSSWKPERININSNGIGNAEGADQMKYIYFLSAAKEPPARPSMAEEMCDDGRPTTNDNGWDDEMTLPTEQCPYLFVSHSRFLEGYWSSFSKPALWKEWRAPETRGKEDDETRRQREQDNKEKRARMSVLRGVAIRIPLLVYGAEINDEAGEEITIDNFASDTIVDNDSWAEFMPKGFTKETFNILKECFDRSIFTGAAKRIRQMVKEADNLKTEDRIAKIATIFSYFHNPDKETVLTPWRVVNMHMSDTVGGWCFFNEEFDGESTTENEHGETVRAARLVDRGNVTQDIFRNYNTRILEINSKTGLYPLYMAYSVFKGAKEPGFRQMALTGERRPAQDAAHYRRQASNDKEIWKDVLQDNIFVVCRTTMAASITRRTLAGFSKDIHTNVRCYEREVAVNDLIAAGVLKPTDEGVEKTCKTYTFCGKETKTCDMISVLRAKPELFERDVVQGRDFWNVYNSIPLTENEDINNMKFNAVVGNPPYQMTVAKKSTENGQKAVINIFHFFQVSSEKLGQYTSLIYPGGRWIHRSGKGLDKFGLEQINDSHLQKVEFFPDANEVFEKVGLPDGISVVLKNANKNTKGFEYIYRTKGEATSFHIINPGDELMPLNPIDIAIAEKIKKFVSTNNLSFLCDSILPRSLFSIESNFVEENPDKVREYNEGDTAFNPKTEIKLFTNDKAGKSGRAKWYVVNRDVITTGTTYLDKWKVVVSSANAGGQKRSNQIAVLDNYSAFGRSRVALKTFNTQNEANNFLRFAQSELIRFAFLLTDENLTALAKQVPDILDYSDKNKLIDFSKDINVQLYTLLGINDADIAHIQKTLATKPE